MWPLLFQQTPDAVNKQQCWLCCADSSSLHRDSMRSEDYIGNSPMSAGLQSLQHLSGPATAFHSGSGPVHAFGRPSMGAVQPSQHLPNPSLVRASTPQTLGTSGGIPVAPPMATGTGHSTTSPVSTSGNVAVQSSNAEDFPADEELKVEGSTPSAPQPVFGQMKPGRLTMSDDAPLVAFPASTVAAGLSGPSAGASMVHNAAHE